MTTTATVPVVFTRRDDSTFTRDITLTVSPDSEPLFKQLTDQFEELTAKLAGTFIGVTGPVPPKYLQLAELNKNGISNDTIAAVLGIDAEEVERLVSASQTHPLDDVTRRFWRLLSAWSMRSWLTPGDLDNAIKGYIYTITSPGLELTPKNVEYLTGVTEDELNRFMKDPGSFPMADKYRLAVGLGRLQSDLSAANPRI